ncbi:Maintenance of mitochondrial morphology protein 1 [Cryomyces minteri]|uniref:Maintenance of mitochondrial morphology protein 1 n=1 Tax=Cryomyces minteri TaxID=331657 RepID=A0A4U0XX91_9PEZI|nr:Maintenance of mitochondrial morphology protein 1 [Cryomyces minteri]
MSKARAQSVAAAAPSSSHSSSLSFTQGVLVGQLILAAIIFFFIKFFIFGEAPHPDIRAAERAAVRRQRTLHHHRTLSTHRRRSSVSSSVRPRPLHDEADANALRRKRSVVLRNPPPLTTATILAKTYYNVNAHQPESLDWFNVLVAQTIAQLRADAQHDDAILTSLTNVLNGSQRPDFLDEIKVTEISLGEDFPIFSNCRVIPVDDGAQGGEGCLQARMDVDLSDVLTLGVETKLVLNYPKSFVAVLPVGLAVSVVRFSGTLSLSFTPSPSPVTPNFTSPDGTSHQSPPSNPQTHLTFTFLDDYRLDLSVRSLVGSRSRLQDVPKIAQLVEARLHAWFDERCVEPRFQQIVLPSLWPRKRNTRGGEEMDMEMDGTNENGTDKEGDSRREEQPASEEAKGKDNDRRDGAKAIVDQPASAIRRQPTERQAPLTDLDHLAAEGAKLREAELKAELKAEQREQREQQNHNQNQKTSLGRSGPASTSTSASATAGARDGVRLRNGLG